MSLQSDVKTVLNVAPLSTTFTGGVISFDDLNGDGLTRTGRPGSFDATTLQLKPTLIIKQRQQNLTDSLRDEAAQHASYVQALEIWYYAPASGSYATLEAAQQTVYGLLHDKRVNGRKLMRREQHTMERDRTLSNAAVCYDVYDAIGVQRP